MKLNELTPSLDVFIWTVESIARDLDALADDASLVPVCQRYMLVEQAMSNYILDNRTLTIGEVQDAHLALCELRDRIIAHMECDHDQS